MDKFCITCSAKLKPQTVVPRWEDSIIEAHAKFYYGQVEKRQAEIDEGRLGYLEEGDFCNQVCAAFFARAALVIINRRLDNSCHLDEVRVMVSYYPWVRKRTEAANKKKKKT